MQTDFSCARSRRNIPPNPPAFFPAGPCNRNRRMPRALSHCGHGICGDRAHPAPWSIRNISPSRDALPAAESDNSRSPPNEQFHPQKAAHPACCANIRLLPPSLVPEFRHQWPEAEAPDTQVLHEPEPDIAFLYSNAKAHRALGFRRKLRAPGNSRTSDSTSHGLKSELWRMN
jgi:hypothetical protein